MKIARRNRLLVRNLPSDYDIIIFHEDDIDRDYLSSMIKNNIKFIDISDTSFRVPEHIPESNIRDIPDGRWGINYRHMCQFRTIDQWEYLSQYDYVMQLDDDGWIESSVNYDIFNYCRKNNYKFCYIDRRGEMHQNTIKTLPKFTKKYVIENNVDINCSIEDIHLNDAFINHIYITNVSFWQRDKIREYLDAIDKSGGIYKYRWGDSPILSLAIKMFMKSKHILEMNDFNYTHGNHNFSNYNKRRIANMIAAVPILGKAIDKFLLINGLNFRESAYWKYWRLKKMTHSYVRKMDMF
jgi:alpha 1,2-mannosyltransferase